jgi:hypothetical protein
MFDYRVVKRNKEFVKRDNVIKKEHVKDVSCNVKRRKIERVRVRKK